MSKRSAKNIDIADILEAKISYRFQKGDIDPTLLLVPMKRDVQAELYYHPVRNRLQYNVR